MPSQWKNIPWKLLGTVALGAMLCFGVIALMGLVSKKDAAQACTSLQIIVEGRETFIGQADIPAIINNE